MLAADIFEIDIDPARAGLGQVIGEGGAKVRDTGIKAQLFKGNEYWFFLGCDADTCELALKIVDAKGKPLHAETKKIKGAIGVRILPPKTGSFAIVFTITSANITKPSWALAYAYR